MAYDAAKEEYKWAKVIDKVLFRETRDAVTVVKYTPDCSKILVAFYTKYGPSFIYLDPLN